MARRKQSGEPAKNRSRKEEKRLDEEIEESFPASDPPSFMGGCHAVGEPRRRETTRKKP